MQSGNPNNFLCEIAGGARRNDDTQTISFLAITSLALQLPPFFGTPLSYFIFEQLYLRGHIFFYFCSFVRFCSK